MRTLRARLLSLAVALGGALAWGAAGAQSGPAGNPVIPRQELLERFDKLTPKARLELVEKLPQAAKEFQPAERGDVVLLVIARGTLESSRNADIYCEVRADTPGTTTATTIRTVLDA